MTTFENIIETANATQDNVAKIQNRLFDVVKVPLSPSPSRFIQQQKNEFIANEMAKFKAEMVAKEIKDFDYPEFVVPSFVSPTFNDTDLFGIFKGSGGSSLSGKKSVGADFTPMQPKEFLNNIIQTVFDFGADLDLNTLEFGQYMGGSRIEFKIKMYPISFKNDKGLQDITNVFLTFSTAYDGSKSNTISVYTERLVCLNGMVRSELESTLKGRNTIGGKAKILSYAKEVAEIVNSMADFKNQLIALDKIKLTKKQIETFKLSLLGFNAETLLASDKKSEARKENILQSLEDSIKLEFNRCGQTAFGLLQGVTYYTNHIANGSKTISNDEYIRFYQGAKINDKAQELLFALID